MRGLLFDLGTEGFSDHAVVDHHESDPAQHGKPSERVGFSGGQPQTVGVGAGLGILTVFEEFLGPAAVTKLKAGNSSQDRGESEEELRETIHTLALLLSGGPVQR